MLTPHEGEVLQPLTSRPTNREALQTPAISKGTGKIYEKRVARKLGGL